MFLLRCPTPQQAARFLAEQRRAGYSYPEVGFTQEAQCPAGSVLDSHTASLGNGDACWTAAKQAVRSWRMFGTPWTQLTNPDAPFQAGETLAVQVAHLGFYSLMANRVVYTLDEPGRFGFAYGTLPGHGVQGEERFLVTQSQEGEVRFELLAFSRPHHPLARLGTPVVRRIQKAAAHAYSAAMLQALSETLRSA